MDELHPNAPRGGCGPGPSRCPGVRGGTDSVVRIQPESPSQKFTNEGVSISPYHRLDATLMRIRSAKSLPELMKVAHDFEDLSRDLEAKGVIRKPSDEDEPIKEAVKSAVTDQLGILSGIVFSAAWDSAENGVDAAMQEAILTSLWEVLEELVEQVFGVLSRKLVVALRDRDAGAVFDALEEAVSILKASLTNKDGLFREALKKLRKKGVFVDQKQMEAVRRMLLGKIEKVLKGLSSITALLSAPVVIAIKILLTPSRVADDANMLYLQVELMRTELTKRLNFLMPMPPIPSTPSLSITRLGPAFVAGSKR